ncbi:hypothetical protein [Streptomyces sp. VRA16 Mangrove soil]|uniref:hypothetical protein n=1 Tax=Streptomyces sp. VRA16 Mangrove soil TaxID=2817434 RepID=UPI001A9E6121|nr:hypothetical protein [Streptomyces sp. VRA16 Mangrove soil]MBO1332730.1 hypothetical protein [Streptomyces sp. VRA16 Mangrove soil]
MNRSTGAAAVGAGALFLALSLPTAPASAADTAPRIDLRVLVVTDGGPATAAIAAELDSEGTPYTTVDLTQSNRPVIDAAFLADTVGGRARAKFQAVVLPNDNPFGAGSAESTALADFEKKFAIPQVDAYTYAKADVGEQPPQFAGILDGTEAQVTDAGKSAAFGYLSGSVPFENNSPDVAESYGYLAQPAAGADFTPYVEAEIPGTGQKGSLVGEYKHDGRRELVVNFVYNQYQQQFRLLARGIVDWMTQGMHLGASRNYFAVHVDDVFLADDRWNSDLNCTPGDVDCPGGGGTPDEIRMTAADAQYAAQWSKQRGFTLDMVFNGGGSEMFKQDNGGSDALAAQLIADKATYRWVNHTYDHPFLGCVQDVSTVPWKCATNANGTTQWVTQAKISQEISDNRGWAQRAGLPLNRAELVTGEHSGLKVLPQQPEDNPNLSGALSLNGVTSLASDASRESEQRKVGPALTVPRHPMNVFYNAGKAAEMVDEYNWIYTSKADGGSGICEGSATTTCLSQPLSADGYTSYIVPLEARTAFGHVLGNDPDPHYIHQSNLAEDRIAYPVLDSVLDKYASLFTSSTPIENLPMAQIATEMKQRAAWRAAVAANKVTAYRIGTTVTVQAPSGVAVTATAPTGTVQQLALGTKTFGSAYAGRQSGWVTPALLQTQVTLRLPN